jgi:hypothetical protein
VHEDDGLALPRRLVADREPPYTGLELRCLDLASSGRSPTRLVRRYSPEGNVSGGSPLSRGRAGSGCSARVSSRYTKAS